MSAKIRFRGTASDRLQNIALLSRSALEVVVRRSYKGPLRPGWNWFVEVGTQMLRKQVTTAFEMKDIQQARRYLNLVTFSSPLMRTVSATPVVHGNIRGSWFSAKDAMTTVLYFHGGGYCFYPQPYDYFIRLITLAAKSRTFALDYRLTPEHRFPAQLEDALNAYRWLLDSGTDPDNLVVAGDSAGGNLALALLLAAREAKFPLPALVIALSAPTDFESEIVNRELDWIEKRMLLQWRDWFCDPTQRCNPLVSPVRADLRGLPPIYIQAGRGEVLYDSVQAFAAYGKNQGADVVLESWKDMNHDFQMFGPDAPQSGEALRRIGQVIDLRVRGRQKKETVSC